MNTKKTVWTTIEEANNYFSKTEREFRWNKIFKKDKQQLLNKSLRLITESGLYVFPDEPEQDMKDAQCEQALWFLTRPDVERKVFEDALHPMAKKKLEKYKIPDLVKKKIKTTNWVDNKDRDRLLEKKFNFGEYELRLSLVYINGVRGTQNILSEMEMIDKIKDHLRKIQKMWKNRNEKYPSFKVLDKFGPGEIKMMDTEIDEPIYKNTDQIIETLSSPKYSIPKYFNFMGNLRINPKSFYIKPQNLIVLTWAKAFISNKRISWKIMLETVNAIYHKIKRADLGDVFDEVDKEEIFKNQETLRQIYIKYTNPENEMNKNKIRYRTRMALIDSIYKKSFIEKISPFYKFL